MKNAFSSVEKKKSSRSSTKHEKLVNQLLLKQKESSNDKRFKQYERSLKSKNTSVGEKSSEKKKRRKRKNASSKELLQKFISPDVDEEDGEKSSSHLVSNENSETGEDDESQDVDPDSTTVSDGKQEIDAEPQVTNDDAKVSNNDDVEEKVKKSLKKPHTTKIKGFYSCLVWDRKGIDPTLFVQNYREHLEAKNCDLNPKRIQQIKSNRNEPSANTSVYSSPTTLYYIKCSFCKNMIENDVAIPICNRIWMHRSCLQMFEKS